jgi:hypothetical protein
VNQPGCFDCPAGSAFWNSPATGSPSSSASA